MQKKDLKISYLFIRRVAIVYIVLPLLCFALGWLKLYFAFIFSVALVISCIYLFKEKEDVENRYIIVPKWMPFSVVSISLTYSFFCGIGRFWAQSKDYPWRNAIFRDLILKDWPVMYEKYGGALDYYIGYWLPPALPGKLAYLLGVDAETAFFVGNVAMLFYTTMGLSILFFLLLTLFKPDKISKMFLIVVMFIFFSGMDIVASIEPLGANNYHLEWWARDYQYSSFTTCMCWVFNQAVIPWICMALLVQENNIRSYVLIGMSCLLSGPFPFIGYFIYCVTYGILFLVKAIKMGQIKTYLKSFFSVSNVLSSLFIFPFIATFLLANAAIAGAGGVSVSNALEQAGTVTPIGEAIWTYIKFVLIEFGIYAIFISRRYKKNAIFYVTILQLLVYPFIRMGYSSDFTMRASIPALYMMYVMCTEFILKEKKDSLKKPTKEIVHTENHIVDKEKVEKSSGDRLRQAKEKGWNLQILKRYGYILLVICLILGAATPSVEFIRGIRQVAMRGIDDPMTDFLYTLGGDGPYGKEKSTPETNFMALNLDEQTFFMYFCRR